MEARRSAGEGGEQQGGGGEAGIGEQHGEVFRLLPAGDAAAQGGDVRVEDDAVGQFDGGGHGRLLRAVPRGRTPGRPQLLVLLIVELSRHACCEIGAAGSRRARCPPRETVDGKRGGGWRRRFQPARPQIRRNTFL
ncbi:hypothetical protein Acry_1596 [Acidiphilium cryptum JF-5]|uniref:Uncharacterized protein n=1 Tax=Acidiphilium cryptum (strain JF-5) TaxID=349163 RepID=A5FYX0_ACICJ|nr:hypothetical protein Acry_1596 [Acidiphilium cryptum JF-5]